MSIRWYILSHLNWKFGWQWEKYAEKKLHCGFYIPKWKLISEYSFWKKYSPINGC